MEIIIGAVALFVTILIVPAFMLGLAFVAVIPLAGIGLLGNLLSSSRSRREPSAPGIEPPGQAQEEDFHRVA